MGSTKESQFHKFTEKSIALKAGPDRRFIPEYQVLAQNLVRFGALHQVATYPVQVFVKNHILAVLTNRQVQGWSGFVGINSIWFRWGKACY